SARAALERFEQVLAREPENRFALSRSGLALLRLGDLPQAIERLRQALATDPGQTETRALLAEALGHAGDYDAAAGEWLEVTRRQPSVARHWSNLGGALGRSGRAQEAVEALARASALEPESVERLSRLAFAEFGAGRLAAAAGHLLAAAENSPALEFSHAGALGMILQRLGRTAEARGWLARAGAGEAEFGPARLELPRIEIAAGNVEAARKALGEALGAAPELRSEASADPLLAVLLAAD
ncbi:MAG: tetratricopeptide repeat protein, partial [Acidobacteria bacterium]|nr:tetratricopeptide repeat protein [Acidobacteriota bacterium]